MQQLKNVILNRLVSWQVALLIGVLWFSHTPGFADTPLQTLVVSYVTAQLNNYEDAVQGVLVTPSGSVLTTQAMSGFGDERIVITDIEIGTYQVYYKALIPILPRVCYIVGGIEVTLCHQPAKQIVFAPKTSRIQSFRQDKSIHSGITTSPVGSFEITQDDLL